MSSHLSGYSFASGEPAWKRGLVSVRNAVRQALVVRQLFSHIDISSGPRVLDVGCGQATVAIELARAGCQVVGVDPSPDLLALAADRLDQEEPDTRARLELLRGDLHGMKDLASGPFDVVCCHGVLMYMPSLDEAVSVLIRAGRGGGLISTLTRNRAGIAMRAGVQGRWKEACAGFDADRHTNRLGMENVRADRPEDVISAFADGGCDPVAWYGVRLFTDHWDDCSPPADFDALLAAEEEAGRRDPYRRLTALTHVLSRSP